MHFEAKNTAVPDHLDLQRENAVKVNTLETQRLLGLIEAAREKIQTTFRKLTDVILKAQTELTPEVAAALFVAGNELANSIAVHKTEEEQLLAELVQQVARQSHELGMMDHEQQIVLNQTWREGQKILDNGSLLGQERSSPFVEALIKRFGINTADIHTSRVDKKKMPTLP